MESNLDIALREQFENKDMCEVKNQLARVRESVSRDFLPQFDDYADEILCIISENPKSLTQKRVKRLIHDESVMVAQKGNTQGTRASLRKMKNIPLAANDSYGGLCDAA